MGSQEAELDDSRYGPVLALVRSGRAESRADVARLAGMSASTASGRVDTLLRRGVLQETGTGASTGGRRPRRLQVRPGLGDVLAVALTSRTAHLTLADATGSVCHRERVPVRLADGPEVVLAELARWVEQARGAASSPLLAAAIGVPGPVGLGGRVVTAAARMPGWNEVDVAALGQRTFGVPTVVENDANLVALGEQARLGAGELVAVRVGTGIGCGLVAGGRLRRGVTGMAGDISHTTVRGAPPVACSCGRAGCLDVVASGSALIGALRSAGVAVPDSRTLLRLVDDGHPLATAMVREAGERVGGVLATVVSVANPAVLVLAGYVSTAATFVSAVTSTIYGTCLPATTAALTIVAVRPDEEPASAGAIQLALDTAFASGMMAARLR